MTRILLLGWDSTDLDTLMPLVKKGRLPNVGKLIRRGTYGRLRSTFVPNSFPAWASFATGVNPGKHGIYYSPRNRPGSYVPGIVNSRTIAVKTLWELLSEEGRGVSVVNLPMTYPPYPINGCMVTGMLTPSLDTTWTYPPELGAEILAEAGKYVIDAKYSYEEKGRTLEETEESIRLRTRAIIHVMRKCPWDVMAAVYTSPDRIFHCFWGDRDPTHPSHDPRTARLYGDAFDRVYGWVDRELGVLMEELGGDVDIAIVSDHASAPLHYDSHVNNILESRGLLKRKAVEKRVATLEALNLKAQNLINDVANKLLDERTPLHERWGAFTKYKSGQAKMLVDDIDWSGTTAYYSMERGIRINLKGREPRGVVEPGDLEKVKERVRRVLLEFSDPARGKVYSDVVDIGSVYHGPELKWAPDMLPVTVDPYTRPWHRFSPKGEFTTANRLGAGDHYTHQRDGIFICAGPSIRGGRRRFDAEIIDIVPTVLYMCSLPVPQNVDGKVLGELLTDKVKKKLGKPGKGPSSAKGKDCGAPAFTGTAKDDELIMDRLRGLGYI